MSISYLGNNKAKLTVSVGSRGNRKQFTKTVTYKLKKDVKDMYREFEDEIKGGVIVDYSVEDLLAWYINLYKLSNGKATTLRAYNIAKKPIISYFKGSKACEVTTYQVQRFITAEAKKHAPKTIKNEVSLLSAAYKKAMRNGMLKDNPCELATLPKIEQRRIKVMSLTDYEKFVELLKECDDLDFKVAMGLALFCGLRSEEILALTESDIDLKNKTVSISKTRHRIKGENVIQVPKTKSSYRVLALPSFLVSDIEALFQEHRDFIQSGEYIIQNSYGESITWNWLSKRLTKFMTDNNLPHLTMHMLRHTHASYLIEKGFEVVEVSAQLGHAQVSTTLNTYSHLLQDASAASRKVASIFEK